LDGDFDTVDVGRNDVFVEGDEDRAFVGIMDTLTAALLFGFIEGDDEGPKETASRDSEVNTLREYVC
jgi:hypothetical protein